MRSCLIRFGLAGILGLAFFFACAPAAKAHAILLEARPAAKSRVEGPDINIRLRFNSRIDGTRSQISLVLTDKSVRALQIEKQQAPEVLSARARGLVSGAYRLRWQVLASDGHITRGEYLFQVK